MTRVLTPSRRRSVRAQVGGAASVVDDPAALSPAEQAQVEQGLRTIHRILLDAGLQVAARVHRYVLDEYFEGRWDYFCDPRRSKQGAFAALCRHPELGVGEGMLRELVRVGEQLLRMNTDLAWCLTVEHHRALLPVPDDGSREQMAELAVTRELTAKELSEEVARRYPPDSRRAGRPRQSKSTKQLSAMHKAFQAVDADKLVAEAPQWSDYQRNLNRERAMVWKALAERILAVVG